MDNFEDNMIDKLILDGALQPAGIDEKTGEMLYQFTPKLKEVMPELYNQHLNHVNSELMNLWEKGFVNMDLLSDSPIVTLAPNAFDNKALSTLSESERWSIEEMKRLIISEEF